MAEGDLIQQAQLPDREAPGGAQAASVSDDNALSRRVLEGLQAQHQAMINARRDDTIGETP
jgi:hypothetical protein